MISKDKQYRTRDKREVRIYATDGASSGPIHGAIKVGDGWEVETWGNDGRWRSQLDDEDSPFDLIEVKPRIKRTYWLNLYSTNLQTAIWETKNLANKMADNNRIACVKVEIDCEEGEGL